MSPKSKQVFYMSSAMIAMTIFYFLIINFLEFIDYASAHGKYPFTADCILFETQIVLPSFMGFLIVLLKLAMILVFLFLFIFLLKEYKKLEEVKEVE